MLRKAPSAERVLFLCLGNICRSPFAEHAFREALESEDGGSRSSRPPGRRLRSESAGFIGPGRPSPPEMQEPARGRGVDLSDHRSRVVTREILQAADLVVVMGPRLRRRLRKRFPRSSAPVLLLGDLDPEPIPGRAIRDPYGKAPGVFADVAARIERCVDVLAEELSGKEVAGEELSGEELAGDGGSAGESADSTDVGR